MIVVYLGGPKMHLVGSDWGFTPQPRLGLTGTYHNLGNLIELLIKGAVQPDSHPVDFGL